MLLEIPPPLRESLGQLRALLPPGSSVRPEVDRFEKTESVRLLGKAALDGAAAYLACLLFELRYYATLVAPQQRAPLLLSGGVTGRVERQLRVFWRGVDAALDAELDAEVEAEDQEADDAAAGGGAAIARGGGAAIAGGGGVLAPAPLRATLLPGLWASLPPESGVRRELLRLEKALSVALLGKAALAGAKAYATCLVEQLQYFAALAEGQQPAPLLLSGGVVGLVLRQLRAWRCAVHRESEQEELEEEAAEEEEAEEHGGAADASEDHAGAPIVSIDDLALPELRVLVEQLEHLLLANSGVLAELAVWVRILAEDESYRACMVDLRKDVLVDFRGLTPELKQQATSWKVLLKSQQFPTAPADGTVGVALSPVTRVADASRVTASPEQARKLNADPPSEVKHDPQKERLVLHPHDGEQRVDTLQSTLGKPWDLETLLPAGPQATRTQAVRLPSDAPLPSAFAAAVGSVQRVPTAATVAEAVEALEPLGARVKEQAALRGHSARTVGELPRAAKACHVLAALGAMQVGGVLARLKRVEGYGPEDPANGWAHDNAVSKNPFLDMPEGALYFQKYARGCGWGVCIRGEGKTNFLVRAVDIDGRGELGMTKFARLVARKLGVTIQVHKSCRTSTGLGRHWAALGGLGRGPLA